MSDYWGVMPAAGRGERFNATVPKQYLRAGAEFLIDRSLDVLLRNGRLRRIVVSLAEDDRWWSHTRHGADPRVTTCTGGATRAQSVRRALERLREWSSHRDWVVVHDAVRPCVGERELPALIEACGDGDVGGALVAPAIDTMKYVREGSDVGLEVDRTLNRRRLMRALTPQMFRFDILTAALDAVIARGEEAGDEAQAMELAGHDVVAVEGDPANVKLTYAHELPMVEAWLAANAPVGATTREAR